MAITTTIKNQNLNLKSQKFLIILLLVILGIAAFFRLWQLDSIPPGLYPDVAMNGNDVLESIKNHDFKLFYPNNNGREGLFMWLIGLSFYIFGISIWSLKFVAAIIGIITVLGLYLLVKELFKTADNKLLEAKGKSIAVLSSFLLAVSFWHTNFSRLGFRAILLPFILVFSFYFLFKGFRNKKLGNFILSGFIFGLGFYTYTSFRLAVLILPFLLILFLLFYKKRGQTKKFLILSFSFLVFIFITALPLGIYFLHNQQDFISRATPISVFAAENPAKEIAKSLILHFGMFNIYGDPNWRHNFAGAPMLPRALGVLFLTGFIYSVIKVLKSIKNKIFLKEGDFIVFGFLLCWWFIMLLPGILTREGTPHALRIIGALPPVYIFTAIGGWWLYEKLQKIVKNKKVLISICVLFLLFISFSEFYKYFFLWGKNQKVAEAFTVNYADIGNFLNSLPNNVQKYVIVNELGSPLYGISIPGQTPMFIEATKFGAPRAIYITFENLDLIKIGKNETVIVPLYDKEALSELEKRFPQGKIKQHKNFWAYNIQK